MLHDGIRINGHPRSEESMRLLRDHLVSFAEDGDDNSLFVRFNELTQRISGLEIMVEANWNCLVKDDSHPGRIISEVPRNLTKEQFMSELIEKYKKRKTSKELFDKLLPEVESLEESDTEKLNRLVDELLEHLRYKKFPIRGLTKMMQLGFLFQELENKVKKEV